MYLGRIGEIGPRDAVFGQARHPYTQALLSAVPSPDHAKGVAGKRITLQGDPPSAANPPSGCRFRTRCWKATEICSQIDPQLQTTDVAEGHLVACHHPEPL
jgi:oligopeptide transport system ATP-binding protein